MIPRYEVKEIAQIWKEDSKYHYFLKVEMALLKVLEKKKIIPRIGPTFNKVKINLPRIHEIEATVHHDVIAFCSSITEQVGDKGKFFHYGCTSSDIIDTALSLQMRDSLIIEIEALKNLKEQLWKKAKSSKYVFTLGRSHGMFAEPMSFGFKFLSYVSEFSRRLSELEDFEKTLSGKMSGAVGNYTVISPAIETEVLNYLKLRTEPLSTQVIPRDHLRKLASIQAGIADALERLAIEIRHLHRSDVNEVVEGFKSGQKGSSTMPHKKNPISSENISGLARVIRSHTLIAHENTLLWHERDISHSSSERMWLPDNFGLCVYALKRASKMIHELHLNTDKIELRAQNEFVSASSYLLHKLLLDFKGTREELYAIIQAASFSATNKKDFENKIKAQIPGSQKLVLPTLKKMYESQINEVYKRVAKSYRLKV